jgi:hypothetical protein
MASGRRGGRALGCPVTATRRAAGAARAHRPAGSQHPPCAAAASPPAPRPHPEGGGEPRADPERSCPVLPRRRLQDRPCSLLLQPTGQCKQLAPCAPRFCYRRSWKAHGLCLVVNIKVQSSFLPEKDDCILLRQRVAFLKGHQSCPYPVANFLKPVGDKPTILSQKFSLFRDVVFYCVSLMSQRQ